MTIRVPVKYRFNANLDRVVLAYQQKMQTRSGNASQKVCVRVQKSDSSGSAYVVTRKMPTWYRLLGGNAHTEYLETSKIEKGKMTTSASQTLPFGGTANTRVVFVADGDATVVFGTVTVTELPAKVRKIAERVFKRFVEKTFTEERTAENVYIHKAPVVTVI